MKVKVLFAPASQDKIFSHLRTQSTSKVNVMILDGDAKMAG